MPQSTVRGQEAAAMMAHIGRKGREDGMIIAMNVPCPGARVLLSRVNNAGEIGLSFSSTDITQEFRIILGNNYGNNHYQ